MTAPYHCLNCEDQRWVCADHKVIPWGEGKNCCGAEGVPCHECNTDNPPADPQWAKVFARAEKEN